MKFTDRLRDYGLTLEEDVIIHDRRVVDASADIIDELEAALKSLKAAVEREAFIEGVSGLASELIPSVNYALAKLEKLNRE